MTDSDKDNTTGNDTTETPKVVKTPPVKTTTKTTPTFINPTSPPPKKGGVWVPDGLGGWKDISKSSNGGTN